MKPIILTFFTLASFFCHAQSDTAIILAAVNTDCSLSESISTNCRLSYDKDVSSGFHLLILRLIKCKTDLGNESIYEAYNGGKRYFIRSDYIKVLAGDLTALDKIKDTAAYRNYIKSYSVKLGFAVNKSVQSSLKKYEQQGLVIINYYGYKENEDLQAVNFYIEFANTSKKTIKYLTVYANFYNSVDDKIIDFGSATKTMRIVGPVSPGEVTSAKFDNVLFSKVFEYSKIQSLKVQYLDGSTKLYTNIKAIEATQQVANYLKQ